MLNSITGLLLRLSSIRNLNRRYLVCGMLLFLSLFCCLLVLSLGVMTGSIFSSYPFFVWNLFLAWIPLLVALYAYVLHRRGKSILWMILLGTVWLIFYPNAPYMITDFVHLPSIGETNDTLYWFRLITIISFAWTGMLIGFVSLYLIQSIVRERLNTYAGWFLVLSSSLLTGFGLYLGRVQRWNSWDILHHPVQLFSDILAHIVQTNLHLQTGSFTLLFGGTLILFYLFLYAMMGLAQWGRKEERVNLDAPLNYSFVKRLPLI